MRLSCADRRASRKPSIVLGVIRSELVDLHLKRLSATTVIAGGVAVRRKTDGQELERAGVVYLLQRTSAGWQFATVAIHDAEDALRPE